MYACVPEIIFFIQVIFRRITTLILIIINKKIIKMKY